MPDNSITIAHAHIIHNETLSLDGESLALGVNYTTLHTTTLSGGPQRKACQGPHTSQMRRKHHNRVQIEM